MLNEIIVALIVFFSAVGIIGKYANHLRLECEEEETK